ncbi:suppressor of fused domain protein [Spirillospora sp. NPDC050679]
MEEELDDAAPGWDAIDQACRRLYGDTEPVHYGTVHKWALGGPDPLDGISAYERAEPVPHWHLVSYGMSELYDKSSENPEESGWGFEFTFRVARGPADDAPPAWALNLLQNLGRYVFGSGNWFEPGHHMNINGPIEADREDCEIRALAFVRDPELGRIDTPHGTVDFLQVVGLTLDEYEATQRWNTDGVLDLLEPRTPLHVTDPRRGSLLTDPGLVAAVEAGIGRDGSSSGALYVTTAGWERDGATATLKVGALQAPAVAQALRGRLPFGRDLLLQAEDSALYFQPEETPALRELDEGALAVAVPQNALDDLVAALVPEAGVRPVPALPGVSVEIVPTAMRDQYGKETGEVVG